MAAPAEKNCVTIVVARGANKGGTGTVDSPFGTLEQARDHLRTLELQPGQHVFVQLREGVYRLDGTVVFDAADSAPPRGSITYGAYAGEKAVVSGGVPITGWQPHEKGVWKAEAGDLRFRQLYVNGATAIRARYPQRGKFFRLVRADQKRRFVVVPRAAIPEMSTGASPEMHVKLLWAEAILRVARIAPDPADASMVRLEFREPEQTGVFQRPWPKFIDNQAFHLENAPELLDTEGEWYQDNGTGTVYYRPKAGENMAEVEVIAPRLETLVALRGTPEAPVQGLKFAGLTFAHSNWTTPSGGYLDTQAGFAYSPPDTPRNIYDNRMPGAFEMEFAMRSVVERCVFTQLGATALDLRRGTIGNRIVGNVFYDIAGRGITLGGFTDADIEADHPLLSGRPGKISAGNVLANNYIRRIGTAYPGCVGIAAGFVRDTIIENNELCDLPYTGISLGWGWRSDLTGLRDNTVRYNHIHRVMRELTDGAGIYTLSLQPGTQIYRNHVHSCTTSPMSHAPHIDNGAIGIYCDEASGGTAGQPFIIRENYVHACSKDYNFHIVGTIVLDGNLSYPQKMNSQRHPGELVASQAGLTDEYADIAKSMPFAGFIEHSEEKLPRAAAQPRPAPAAGGSP